MARARARVETRGPIAAAEELWYDHRRWPSFVEGFAHLVRVDGDWPRAGAHVTWDSVRAGRGRVVERVVAYEPRIGQTVQVDDPKLRGTQRVAFEAGEEGAIAVSLELDYGLKSPGPLGPVVNLLFVRRALVDSLRRTLLRFARELEAEPEMTR
jgi:polyketide cyclase/dehydrase/lipid transport protein